MVSFVVSALRFLRLLRLFVARTSLVMSRLAVYKLSKLPSSIKRILPLSSFTFQSRSAPLLSHVITRSLSTAAPSLHSLPTVRACRVSGYSIATTGHLSRPRLQPTSATCTVTITRTRERSYHSSSSSSSSRIPRSLVLVAPAAVFAFLLSELELTPSVDCAALPTLSGGGSTPSSMSLGPSPRLLTPLAGDDYVVASWWRRIVAFLIDNSLVSLAFSLADKYLAPLTGPYGSVAVPLLSFVFNFTYETACYMYSDGQTLGKWLLAIRVVRDDGQPMDVSTGALLFGGKVLNILLMADVLYGLLNLDRDGRCIHNVISGTTVVKKVPAETFIQTVQV